MSDECPFTWRFCEIFNAQSQSTFLPRLLSSLTKTHQKHHCTSLNFDWVSKQWYTTQKWEEFIQICLSLLKHHVGYAGITESVVISYIWWKKFCWRLDDVIRHLYLYLSLILCYTLFVEQGTKASLTQSKPAHPPPALLTLQFHYGWRHSCVLSLLVELTPPLTYKMKYIKSFYSH